VIEELGHPEEGLVLVTGESCAVVASSEAGGQVWAAGVEVREGSQDVLQPDGRALLTLFSIFSTTPNIRYGRK